MKEFGSITALEAIRDIGCFRLASRITDLKRKGYRIERDMIKVKNRYGQTTRIARYKLESGI